jgi:AcrR family transcriptional regulator
MCSDGMSRTDTAHAETWPAPERADSRRKRLRLIEAGRLVVAEKGLDAGAAEIAARAEVGVGTLYRRFGTREAPVKDILTDGIAEIQAVVDRALAAPKAETPYRCRQAGGGHREVDRTAHVDVMYDIALRICVGALRSTTRRR